MATSFPVGLAKVKAGTQPKLTIVSGNEHGLNKLISSAFHSDSCNNYIYFGGNKELSSLLFVQGARSIRDTRIRITDASMCRDWDWLPIWFNKVKRAKLLVETGPNSRLVQKLETVANTRGININCNAPVGETAKNKMVKFFADRYSQSPTQINLMLNQNHWRISPCLELLDKLSLLNLSLNSDTISKIGIVHDPMDEVFWAITANNKPAALDAAKRVSTGDYIKLVNKLSSWLDKLSRIKTTKVMMKSNAEIAFETGIDQQEIEYTLSIARRYEFSNINKIGMALAVADKALAEGHTTAVLELLITAW